ncbi:MAG: choice-of-anchor L domain-containing protein [Myxococcaceae bacterium]|nr:choice-of-anchor L domain-containing protein [Myxococcaceae bacterium]MCA3013970.1 choice-of-anchor L domain-containing protein [Myxococcaceae bacterium]
MVCREPRVLCGDFCVDSRSDRRHCGACDQACQPGDVCADGQCTPCGSGEVVCFNTCVSLASDGDNCGSCGARCAGGSCSGGGCRCSASQTACPGGCFDLATSRLHCGACQNRCTASESCVAGACTLTCAAGLRPCERACVDPRTSRQHCGGCNRACGQTQECDAGVCAEPPDLDGDGFTRLTGDCCETQAECPTPARVSPGEVEVPGNGIDDDCDGRVDTVRRDGGCDDGLALGGATAAEDYARAMDVCVGLVSASVVRGDGSAFSGPPPGIGIQERLGPLGPSAGSRLLVLTSGRANLPGLVGSASGGFRPLDVCAGTGCLQDWLAASNGSLKSPGLLPSSPMCQAGSADVRAFDSVMLRLSLQAPPTANAFEVDARFYSLEYPEYVCSAFNDQVVFLSSSSAPGQPADGNLLTFTSMGVSWPIGINVAAGTPLFQACDTQMQRPLCWDPDVSSASCHEGASVLAGTMFDRLTANGCLSGGATSQLVVRGNVRPGERFDVRIAIWDVGDPILDSVLVLDGFRWLGQPVTPGTTGMRVDGGSID